MKSVKPNDRKTPMKEMGIRPNYSDVARRYGVDRHTVAKYWNGGGERPADMRGGRPSGFDRYAEEIEGRAQMAGVTAKGIHEWLLDRHAEDGGIPGYNALTHWLRTHGVVLGRAAEPEAHPRFETPPGLQLQFDWKEDLAMRSRSGDGHRFQAARGGHPVVRHPAAYRRARRQLPAVHRDSRAHGGTTALRRSETDRSLERDPLNLHKA